MSFAVPKSMCFVKIPTAQAELLVNAVTFKSFAADMVKMLTPFFSGLAKIFLKYVQGQKYHKLPGLSTIKSSNLNFP